jgi:hypothetical protein
MFHVKQFYEFESHLAPTQRPILKSQYFCRSDFCLHELSYGQVHKIGDVAWT